MPFFVATLMLHCQSNARLFCQGWTTFSIVPPSPNPQSKLNQRLLKEVLTHDLMNISNPRLINGGGRIAFEAIESDSFQEWPKILAPFGVKSLRMVVAQSNQIQPHFEESDVIDSLWTNWTLYMPWKIYEKFGNAIYKQDHNISEIDPPAKFSVRRYASCCVPKAQSSTTRLANLLRQRMRNSTLGGEWTLLLFDNHCCWLEWTLLVTPDPAATMDLPRPGCKRVEAWMLLQNLPKNDNPSFMLLDPLCGKGTYLVEAATTLRRDRPNMTCLGVDLSASQLKDAECNIEATKTSNQVHIKQGNASDMHWLDDHSVDAIVTCPPFGIQFGNMSDLPSLYQDWLREWIRVLCPQGGRLVLLVNLETQDMALRAIEDTQRMVVRIHREPFRLGRLQATVIVADVISSSDESANANDRRAKPLRHFPWENPHVRESRAEWARLRAESFQQLVPYSTEST